MRGLALRTRSVAAFGDTVVVSDVAGACFGTHLAQHDLESLYLFILLLLLLLLLLLVLLL